MTTMMTAAMTNSPLSLTKKKILIIIVTAMTDCGNNKGVSNGIDIDFNGEDNNNWNVEDEHDNDSDDINYNN